MPRDACQCAGGKRFKVQKRKLAVASGSWQRGLGFKVQGSKKEVGSSQWQLAGDVGFKVQGSRFKWWQPVAVDKGVLQLVDIKVFLRTVTAY